MKFYQYRHKIINFGVVNPTMEIYKSSNKWKWALATLGMIIVIITMIYSQYLARQLKDREEATVQLFKDAVEYVMSKVDEDPEGDNLIFPDLILSKFNGIMPVIFEDESGRLEGYNYGSSDEINTDQAFLTKRKERLLKKGFQPIEGYGSSHYMYYEHSRLYFLVSYFPFAQILLLSTFVLFGYFIFSASRRAEQNRIWAGMAKETAHQLGTPISAIWGWIQHLKDISNNQPDIDEVVTELKNDVDRLDLIADRFSKIGSTPILTKTNLVEELNDCMRYMVRRAPQKIKFNFPSPAHKPLFSNINQHLFDWVIENLLRNALDAMDNQGAITCEIQQVENLINIDISDTGKGIPNKHFKEVFNPGFSTKKRGWGLGLSLAKRIIENYHSGKIFVKNSKEGQGTTFTIQLPAT